MGGCREKAKTEAKNETKQALIAPVKQSLA
jgi:hypothetical protein